MSLRVRLLGVLATYGLVLAVALVVLGLVGLGSAVDTYTSPPVETVSEETNQQSFATELQTSATVTNDSRLYETGRELRNMPVYFSNGTPELTYHVKTTGPADTDLQVDQRLVLRLSAARDGQRYWQYRRVLASDSATVRDGTHWVNTTVNMTEVRSTIEEKQSITSAVGTFDVRIQLNTTYETPQYSGTLSTNTGLVTTGRAYWLQSHPSDSATHSQTRTERVVGEPDLAQVGILGGLGILAIVGGLAVFRTYRELDHEYIATERSRAQYEEWISNGEIPTKSGKEYVRVDSLEDLVDIAIDTSKRVIYDTELDAYGVIEGDLVYYYTTGDDDLTNWIDI